MKNIGAILKQKREEMGLSQGALARKIGVTRHSVYCYETGRRYPCNAVADFFGLPHRDKADAALCPVFVGARGTVYAETIGTVKGVKKAYPCTCVNINPQGIACLEFELKLGKVRECFPITDSALSVEWR